MKGVLFLFLGVLIPATVWTQTSSAGLDLPDTIPCEARKVFSLEVNAYWESKLMEISGQKLELPINEIECDGLVHRTKSVKTRGKTTLYFERKSFSLSLLDPIAVGTTEVKKLALNNLAMDRNYFRNRLSFLLMEQIGIFRLQNCYSELLINGRTNGIYLAIQKPDDYVRSQGSTLLVRRDYEERFRIEDAWGTDSKVQMKRLRGMRKLTKKYEGQQLYDSLDAIVDLDHYFRWLAFNSLVKNGDYTDELFLYLVGAENRFDIVPWDYDDIFQREPHDGFEQRNRVLGHKMLFSGEEYLDLVIDSDDYLYREYLRTYTQVIEILNPEALRETFERVYMELYPYYSDQEVIALSALDYYGLTDLSTLKTDLQNRYQLLLNQRQSAARIIASEMRHLMEIR